MDFGAGQGGRLNERGAAYLSSYATATRRQLARQSGAINNTLRSLRKKTLALADRILFLINAQPSTPTRE
jgi:hypothetical protein